METDTHDTIQYFDEKLTKVELRETKVSSVSYCKTHRSIFYQFFWVFCLFFLPVVTTLV